MASDVEEELRSLQREYDWVLKNEVQAAFSELQGILTEACRRFPLTLHSGPESLVKPEKFVLSGPKGTLQLKCMLTLLADSVCEAEISIRLNKQQSLPTVARITPDGPWRLQQIQDAGNYLVKALACLCKRDDGYTFKSGREVNHVLDKVLDNLNRGRSCLALPRKRSLEELAKNENLRVFQPALPTDIVLSFYVHAQKLVLAVYQLYLNQSQKVDILSRHQVECPVPWLNDILVLFTVALHHCQQLRDKITVFMQYETELASLEASCRDVIDQRVEEAPLISFV